MVCPLCTLAAHLNFPFAAWAMISNPKPISINSILSPYIINLLNINISMTQIMNASKLIVCVIFNAVMPTIIKKVVINIAIGLILPS